MIILDWKLYIRLALETLLALCSVDSLSFLLLCYYFLCFVVVLFACLFVCVCLCVCVRACVRTCFYGPGRGGG